MGVIESPRAAAVASTSGRQFQASVRQGPTIAQSGPLVPRSEEFGQRVASPARCGGTGRLPTDRGYARSRWPSPGGARRIRPRGGREQAVGDLVDGPVAARRGDDREPTRGRPASQVDGMPGTLRGPELGPRVPARHRGLEPFLGPPLPGRRVEDHANRGRSGRRCCVGHGLFPSGAAWIGNPLFPRGDGGGPDDTRLHRRAIVISISVCTLFMAKHGANTRIRVTRLRPGRYTREA
jgi:hypothetical protein